MGGAVHRLHGRVREERYLIGRLDLGRGSRHGAADIADALRNYARIERGVFEFVRDIVGVELGMRTVVPFDLQGRETFLRGTHVIGYDRDGVVEAYDLAHALDGPGRRIIDTLHATAEYGRLRERGDLHVGRPNIDAVDGRAVDLGWRIQTFRPRADELEIL